MSSPITVLDETDAKVKANNTKVILSVPQMVIGEVDEADADLLKEHNSDMKTTSVSDNVGGDGGGNHVKLVQTVSHGISLDDLADNPRKMSQDGFLTAVDG